MKQFFLFLVTGFFSASALAVNYCNFGQDEFDKDFMAKYDGATGWMPAESTVRMRGRSDVYYCKLREKQLVALHPQTGEPVAFVTCGNPILDYAVPQQVAQQQQVAQAASQPRDNTFLELSKRPMGQVQVVDACNGKCAATAAQFKFLFNAGVGAYWQHRTGVSDDVTLTNTQSQSQSTSGRGGSGGSGGSSSTKTIVRNDGGGNGGGDPGGPEDPNNPPSNNGGGPVDPNNGPVDPNNP